jgi:hypothetical protein
MSSPSTAPVKMPETLQARGETRTVMEWHALCSMTGGRDKDYTMAV